RLMVHSLLNAPINTHGFDRRSASVTDRTPRSCDFLPFCANNSENCENACASPNPTYRSHIGTISSNETVGNPGGGFWFSVPLANHLSNSDCAFDLKLYVLG